MTKTLNYTKAFAKALAEHLRGRVPEFTEKEYGGGGCETCGYGGDVYDVLDMGRLEKEIDAFSKTFKVPKE